MKLPVAIPGRLSGHRTKRVAQPIVDKLHDEIGKILNQSDVRDRLATLGAQPLEMTRQAFIQHIQTESERFAKVVKQAKIRIE